MKIQRSIYDDCDPDLIIDYIPSPTSWGDGDEKTLCIIDDIDFQNILQVGHDWRQNFVSDIVVIDGNTVNGCQSL